MSTACIPCVVLISRKAPIIEAISAVGKVVISKMETATLRNVVSVRVQHNKRNNAFNRTQAITSDFDRAVAKLIEGQDGGAEK